MQRYSRRQSFPTCSQQNQGKERRGELDSQKSSRGMRLWGGCEVIGLGARVAKIKQVCSVTTRGGEKERGRKRGEREGGREGSRRAEGPDNWWRTPLLSFCCENRGRGKKMRGSGYREAGWMERKRRRELVLGVTLAVTSGNERSGGECTLSSFFPSSRFICRPPRHDI